MAVKFGTQFGSGASSQLAQAIADGLIGRMRFSHSTDPQVPLGTNPNFWQYPAYCKQHGVIPHIILADHEIPYLDAYRPVLYMALQRLFYVEGIQEASFGVGNEADSQLGSWDCVTADNDCCFNAYLTRYKVCADTLTAFMANTPQARYTLGAGAGVTGLTFGCRVANWCKSEGVKIDFIDGHFGTEAKPDAVKREVLMARAFGLPVWCTEMGYGYNLTQSASPEAVRWVKDMLQVGFDEIFWLIHTNPEGQGIWMPDGTVTPMGEVMLDYRRVLK